METSRDLATLISELPGEILTGSVHCPVKDLTTDSRHVQRDTLFTALRGTRTDGHLFLAEALDRGAGALVVEELPVTLWPRVQAEGQTVIRVPDCHQAVAMLASAYYQHPARQLSLIGITGTNGKTTTAYIVEAILQAAGEAVGMLGTVGYHIGTKRLPATTDHPRRHAAAGPAVSNGRRGHPLCSDGSFKPCPDARTRTGLSFCSGRIYQLES